MLQQFYIEASVKRTTTQCQRSMEHQHAQYSTQDNAVEHKYEQGNHHGQISSVVPK